ncbi:Response regulator mcs4 [Madurella mycetomatis]|uniref:Response regulator mcs4 n=1 Tax=Madurella mycetomatis TaxID=100816 RepID=A0A175W5K8_9PEZI|nr:Response regulator mcs4 [Madurella mycetomatis]
MGDLRSRLRAKFPRRHSGIPPLPSSKSGNYSSSSNNGPEPDPAAIAAKGLETAATAASGARRGSHSGSSPDRRQATRVAGLRLGTTRQSDARGTVGVSDAVSGRNGYAAAPSPTASEPAANSRASAKSATNSPPRPVRAISMYCTSEGPSIDGQDLSGNDRRVSAASRLESVDEILADGRPGSMPPSDTVPTDDSRAAGSTADAVRRIHLIDPPASSDSATPATRPAAPAPPPSSNEDPVGSTSNPQLRPSGSLTRPAAPPRRQSLLPSRQTTLIRTLLNAGHADDIDPGAADQLLPISANMVTRKLWVKRPGGSATLVTINEEDLVDDVRELILRKYANSLGRQFDAPDLTLRIVPREQQRQERVLGPEEPMARTLDAYFPGGQTVDEALIIDIPHRRTPRASPRNGPPHVQHLASAGYEDALPLEAGTDYFGPGAVAHIPVTIAGSGPNGPTHAISVLNTGQVPQIPSPGGTRTRAYRERPDRPRLGRQHTSSPTILNVVGAGGHPATIAVSASHDRTPCPAVADTPGPGAHARLDPANRHPAASVVLAPTPAAARPKKKKTTETPTLPAGMLNGGVPPINVLIVEDNIINLRLLEAFVKRLKVRWQTAMNGREAVDKWRMGGFHLVLMDIQLPVMSGLEATREIRRLERMNSIGAFSSTPTDNNNNSSSPTSSPTSTKSGGGGGEKEETANETAEEDKLPNRELFKSPVIIVALTASSLQSDRHEALAAGCNDFLTKPVTYVWLERKVMEWGCMQALIDYDGWRKWKSYSQKPDGEDSAAKKAKTKKNRQAPNSSSSDGQ